ncbi:MAG TPA: aldo/keto reductase [Blastocatellia bacterium]|nr:aldo/keto reductase [Blastocatellia bacterium]
MQTRILGKSGIEVSEIGIGCWAIGGLDWNLNMGMGWGGTDDRQSLEGLHRAFDFGATYFDTADIYGHGHSERLIGQLLRNVRRDQVIIGTKVGYFRGCAPSAYHPLHMRHQLEMSLRNLGTDYIDIYYFHNLFFGENDEYVDGAVEAMHRFQEEGKVRFIGQRGPHRYSPHRQQERDLLESKQARFLRMASIIQPSVVQVRYNMITPPPDDRQYDMFQWAKDHQVGVVINKPLGQGLLLAKYDPHNPPIFDQGDHRQRKKWFTAHALGVLQSRLALLKNRFGNSTQDLLRVAIQYCLYGHQNACVVVGFKNASQVEMSLASADRPLTEEDVIFIRATMKGINEEIGSFFLRE